MSSKILEFITYRADHPAITASLIGAGVVPSVAPSWFVNAPIQNVYYLLLIPPAAWSLYVWAKNNLWPYIRQWLKK